jgi:hypothetical protein
MSNIYTTVTWDELNCPPEPCRVECKGMTIQIKQSHIDAANNDPSATFAVIRFQPLSGPAGYNLGTRIDD